MNTKYFKFRKRFSLFPNPYDLGNAFGLWNRIADRHFLSKLYKLSEDEYKDFYSHHLDHNLKNQIIAEREFFTKLWYLVARHIYNLEKLGEKNACSGPQIDALYKLRQFREFLNNTDKWNAKPASMIIAEKEFLIQYYKEENTRLKKIVAEISQQPFVTIL